MKRTLVLLASLLLVYPSVAQKAGDGPPTTIENGDNDPLILPEEIVAPAMDSTDSAWKPIYAHAEDPASIRCDGRDACESHKSTETAKSQSQTTSEAAR